MRSYSFILLAVLVVSILTTVLFVNNVFDTTIVWLILLFLTSVAFLVSDKKLEMFHPGIAFPIVYSFLYGMGFLYLWLNNGEHALSVLVYSVIGLIAYQIGVSLFVGRSNLKISIFRLDLDLFLLRLILFVVACVSLLSAAYIYKVIGIPILADDIYHIREIGFNKVSHYSLFLLRNIGLVFNILFLVTCAATMYISNKQKLHLSILFVVAFLMLLSTAGRADLMFLFVLFVINYHYVVKNISLTRSAAVTSSFIVLIIVYNYLRMYQYSGSHETIIFLSEKFNGNQFYMFLYHVLAQVSLLGVTFQDVIDKIPDQLPFFNGMVIPITLSTYLPGHQAPPGAILKEMGGINFTGGQANLTLLGDFYADFGVAGIVIGMFLLGSVVSLLYRRLCRTKKISLLILYTYVLYSLIVGLPGGLFSQAIRYYYFLIILLIIFFSGKSFKAIIKKNINVL